MGGGDGSEISPGTVGAGSSGVLLGGWMTVSEADEVPGGWLPVMKLHANPTMARLRIIQEIPL
jgi:hypothetical protein